jgi:hypothetical protein
MSREELVQAYLSGGLSRRMFIRRLVAGGVSLGAAVSYAHLLTPERASASRSTRHAAADHYTPGQIEVRLKSRRLSKVLDRGDLRIQLSVGDAARVEVTATTRQQGKRIAIARGKVDFASPGERTLDLPLTKGGRHALAGRDELRVKLTAAAPGLQGDTTVDTLE